MKPERIEMFGIEIDALRMSGAVDRLMTWLHAESSSTCKFVVTPNVDHTVILQTSAPLREAYEDANLVLADGWPVVLASRLFGKSLPERVTGSDLIPALFNAASGAAPLKVFLLGAAPGVAQRAAVNVHRQFPNVQIVGTYSPPLGFENDATENQKIMERIADAEPQLLVIGLGAPKQELWIHQHRHEVAAKVAVCAGATIDFLAGEKSRAPKWMQRTGLEWAYRIGTDPKRLAKRYAKDAVVFPRILWNEWTKPGLRRPDFSK
ncbi:WecB/TagA/CpsF family glycosyltransferase [Bremerella sp. T1]|uniref:WecB/TagA/CpsF family glycosyltransferase n=1 Tax=Bremerella sp. TYQ1 TaxID=3119568 RepID=UPI001CCD0ECD|nr:WecB/TagA/CpsF family glycosyltransferase [Bremerella volcania]UBM34016.1 WecB/TagA/CpsF family glycosyltransferase [Bremerella volcania]